MSEVPPDILVEVGIGVGVAVFILLALFICLCLYLRWKKTRKSSIKGSTMTYQCTSAADLKDETYEYVPQSIGSYTYPVLEESNEDYDDVLQDIMTQNVAYGMGKEEVNVSRNVAYSAAVVRDDDEVVYDYATTVTGDQVLPRDNVPVSLNQAYIAAHECTLAL